MTEQGKGFLTRGWCEKGVETTRYGPPPSMMLLDLSMSKS